MAFEQVIPDADETSLYWEANKIGESIEGNICAFEEDNWGNTRIRLELESGAEKVLPSHRDLMRYNSSLEIGDYIRVTLSDIKKSDNPEYNDKMIYEVVRDRERAVIYEEVDYDDY
jgi:hypothetical protein